MLGAQFTHIIIISALFACKKQFEYLPMEILMSIKKDTVLHTGLKSRSPPRVFQERKGINNLQNNTVCPKKVPLIKKRTSKCDLNTNIYLQKNHNVYVHLFKQKKKSEG